MARRAGKNKKVRAHQRADAEAREALERRWVYRREEAPELADAVTFEDNHGEPRHRWLPYRQGLSHTLVSWFLESATLCPGPVLDPFSGSGTVPLQCARAGRAGIGVEAIPALAFLGLQKGATTQAAPPLPELADDADFPDWSRALTHPLHRTALLAAAARTASGSGRKRKDAGTASALLQEAMAMILEDLADPCRGSLELLVGDARRLPLADNSIGGVLTSPPYLTRYDYARVNQQIAQLYTYPAGDLPRRLVSANFLAHGRRSATAEHPAVAEAAAKLQKDAHRKQAAVVGAYFEDLANATSEIARVLAPGAPAWIVIGGAFLKKVYLPTDLILAEMAEQRGLVLERLLVARRLSRMGRSLGSMGPVDSRESILVLRKL